MPTKKQYDKLKADPERHEAYLQQMARARARRVDSPKAIERKKISAKKWHENRRQKFNAYKSTLNCSICGYNRCISALDFHHVNGHKEKAVSQYQVTWDKLMEEVSKCIVVCSNCHREIHHKERESYLD